MPMNIYTASGRRVKYVNLQNGNQGDKDHARKHLQSGGMYTVHRTEVGSYACYVTLREVPGEKFNSVMFENA